MAYTVKKLAKISGVSIRTLHWYDEIGLLKPAYHGTNGYRYYEEEQLLALQQILFFRELGFELGQIQPILEADDFDQAEALCSHRKILMKNLEGTKKLIKTIDKTLKHLQGIKKMEDQEMYEGFISKEKQAEYITYMENRIGKDHPSFAECENNTKDWKDKDRKMAMKDCYSIFGAFAKHLEGKKAADSEEVQKSIAKLYGWVKQFWTPDKESFPALGQMYTDFEWKKFFSKFDPHHPRLATYIADGMKVYADKELS